VAHQKYQNNTFIECLALWAGNIIFPSIMGFIYHCYASIVLLSILSSSPQEVVGNQFKIKEKSGILSPEIGKSTLRRTSFCNV